MMSQCQFCDRIFDTQEEVEQHIKEKHHKVKVRRGNSYKWIDWVQLAELKK